MKGLARSISRGSATGGTIRKQTFAVRNASVSVAGTTGIGFGSVVIGDLPDGNILFLGATSYFEFAGPTSASLGDTWSGDYGVGTTANGDTSLATTEIDIIDSTPVGPAVAEVSPRTRGTHAVANTGAILDNTDGSLELNLNVLVDDADISATVALTVNGELTIAYMVLGDD